MLHGKRINLRLIRNEDECQKLLEAFNDLSQRGSADHTELKHPQSKLKKFAENGLWGEEQGTLLITDKQDTMLGIIGNNVYPPGIHLLQEADTGYFWKS